MGSLRLHEENLPCRLPCVLRFASVQRTRLCVSTARITCRLQLGRARIGLRCLQLKRGDEIVATNRTTRLVFDVNSHYAEINGVQVALSFPVANEKASPSSRNSILIRRFARCFSRGDMLPQKPSRPFVSTPAMAARIRAIVSSGIARKPTASLSPELRDQLKKAGFNVVLTRTKDTYVELPDRPALANRRDADLFVSLHFNATQTGRDQSKGRELIASHP